MNEKFYFIESIINGLYDVFISDLNNDLIILIRTYISRDVNPSNEINFKYIVSDLMFDDALKLKLLLNIIKYTEKQN